MSETWEKILNLVQRGEIVVSEHGYEEIAADDIRVRIIVSGVANGEVIEDYPEYRKAPVFWFCNLIRAGGLYMPFGASPEALHPLRC